MIIILLTLILLISYLFISIYFISTTFYPKVISYEKLYKDEMDRGMLDNNWFEKLGKESITIQSRYGYNLEGVWIPVEDSKKSVIIVHGFKNNLNGSIRYASIFINLGFNVLLYDQRYHGKSGGNSCSFGYFEKFDLVTIFDWVTNKTGNDSIVGVHGESMGAATALMHGAIDDRVSFIISDCSFSDLWLQFGNKLREYFILPIQPVLVISSLLSKVFTGVSYKMISPLSDVKKIDAPICFIHGKKDSMTDVSQSEDLYFTKIDNKEIYLVDEVDHAQAILFDKVQYSKVIENFITSKVVM